MLPLPVGIRDGAVQLASTLGGVFTSARAWLGSILVSALPVAAALTSSACVRLRRTGWKDTAHDFALEHLAIVLMAKASPRNVRLWVSTGGVTSPAERPSPPPPSPPSPPPQGGALAFLSSIRTKPSSSGEHASAALSSQLKPRVTNPLHDPRAHRPDADHVRPFGGRALSY